MTHGTTARACHDEIRDVVSERRLTVTRERNRRAKNHFVRLS